MAGQCLSFLKVQTFHNCVKVRIPLFDVAMPGSKVRSQEAEASIVIVQSDSNAAFVSGHAPQTSLI
jgi:hypothetical protein